MKLKHQNIEGSLGRTALAYVSHCDANNAK
jgi:hypothetical protein